MNNINKTKFSVIPYDKIIPKPWGHEVKLTAEDTAYTGKIMVVSAGKRWSLHYHDAKSETLTLISGQVALWLEDSNGNIQKIDMDPHKGYQVLPGQIHRVEAITDAIIVESSLPEQGSVTVRVEDDYKRSDENDDVRKDPNRGWKIPS